MASKKKVSLSDYELGTTLGTGMFFFQLLEHVRWKLMVKQYFRFIWKSHVGKEQEDWWILRYETAKEGRYYKA